MAAIILPHRWQQQPQCPVEVDWSNPITRGLKFAWSAGSEIDLVRQLAPTVRAPLTPTNRGLAAIGDGSSYIQFQTLPPPVSGADFSFFGLLTITNTTAYTESFPFALEEAYTNQWRVNLYHDGTNLNLGSPGAGERNIGAHTINQDVFSIGVSTASGVTNGITSYKNGRLVHTTTGTNTMPGLNVPVSVNRKNYFVQANSSGHGTLLSLFWGRALTAAEQVALNANPWQIFKPQRRILYFDAGGGATPTSVQATAGTIVLGGGVGSILSSTTVPATNATVVLAGQQATIRQTTLIPATAGTIVLAGTTAGLTETSAVAATAGVIALTGTTATIAEGAETKVQCTAGTIVLTGTTATLWEAVATSVQCTAGTVVVGGTQATIWEAVATSVGCTAGTIVVSGTQATITESVPVTTSVECRAGTIVCVGGEGSVSAQGGLKGRRPRRRYTTYVEPTAPEVPGTPPAQHGAAFGALAPVLPAPAITPPLAPAKPRLVVIEGRAHVEETALPSPVVDRAAKVLEHLAAAVRNDPRIARQVIDALVPLLTSPDDDEDEEEEIIRLLLQQIAA